VLGTWHPPSAGRLRREPVWIGGSDLSPAGALFVPPHHERVPAALEDLLSFLHRSDLPPLTKAALAHAQLETIHPFADGNGRTGRALTHIVLSGEGLSLTAPLPLSAILLTNVRAYFRALDEYRSGAPLAVVELFIDAARRAAELGAWAGRELDDVEVADAPRFAEPGRQHGWGSGRHSSVDRAWHVRTSGGQMVAPWVFACNSAPIVLGNAAT